MRNRTLAAAENQSYALLTVMTQIMQHLTRLLCLSMAILIFGCKPEAPKAPPAPSAVAVTVTPVIVQSVQRTVDVVGTLVGTEDATISAKVSGRIITINKDMGDRAKAGEVLAQIDKTDYELSLRQKELAEREVLAKLGLDKLPEGEFDPNNVPTVQQAKFKAENEKAKFNRGKQLHEQQPPLLSDQDYADLKTGYEVAQSSAEVELLTARSLLNQAQSLHAQANIAQQAMQDATVVSPNPSSGQLPAEQHSYAIATRMVSVGEYVQEGAQLFRLIDDDPVKLRATVPERYVADVRVGQRVGVRVEAYRDGFEGKLTRINPQIDPANRTFQIEAVVPNEKRLLKPGGFAQASVETRLDPKVVFVPRDAIVTFAGVNKVFTVGADGKAIEHPLDLGDARGELMEVVKGLDGTESVVIEGNTRLATGTAVTVKDATKPASADQKVASQK
ncbi:MAG: efflux RND transporter periplasmic adaptor subunit [Anaerolineae bacterium]|nr:efflux RND transporter periplasmic adaptor subunit [Phycisphaerae bacterium]